jgi:hypothetical protein
MLFTTKTDSSCSTIASPYHQNPTQTDTNLNNLSTSRGKTDTSAGKTGLKIKKVMILLNECVYRIGLGA